MNPKTIIFTREGRNIIGTVFSRYMEPLGHGRYLEVLFCKDSEGYRYRVPRHEVIAQGRVKKKGKKKKVKVR